MSKQDKRYNILNTLRDRIVDGHYPQGLKLVENDLASEFQVSRPMLREVLAELENQGLVERKPNRGAMVRRVDTESLMEIMEIREVLEGLCARLAAQKSKPEDWLDLREAFGERADNMIEHHEFESYLGLVAAFRERMVKASRNRELAKLTYSLFAKITIVQRRIVILPGRMEEAIKEHREVLEAIMAGDPEKAEEAKRRNLRNAREYLEKYKSWVL
ncbi:MAG: GntR family transcriptional regulator [Thermodesulfobacteriota bacterium]